MIFNTFLFPSRQPKYVSFTGGAHRELMLGSYLRKLRARGRRIMVSVLGSVSSPCLRQEGINKCSQVWSKWDRVLV